MRTGTVVFAMFAGLICAGLASPAQAGREEERAGKIANKKFCRSCHDGTVAKVNALEPKTYLGKHWVDYFETKLKVDHKDVVDPKNGNKKVLELLSDEKLKNILEYLRNHGADSDQPATCG